MQRRIAGTVVLLVAMLALALCADFSPEPPVAGTPRSLPVQLSVPQPSRPPFAPEIRVSLTDEPVASLQIQIGGPYRVQPAGSTQELARGTRLAASTVTATATGVALGDQQFPVARIEIVPERSPAIWIDGHQYRGRLRLLRQSGGRVRAVNVLPLESYVASVIDSEMPAAFPEPARRAQTIVARTYALWQRERRHPDFDLFASTRSQRYLGFQYRAPDGRRLAGESDESRRLAGETAGMVCTREGRLFCTYYSAVCGGRTVAGGALFEDADALPSVSCPWCCAAPLYRWRRSVPRAEFEGLLARVLPAKLTPFGALRSVAAHEQPDGTVAFTFGDGRHEHQVDAAILRGRIGPDVLPSARFRIELHADEVVFRGRGHGHGVGFCQWGARGLALAGRSALQIIRHYYPDADVIALEADGRM